MVSLRTIDTSFVSLVILIFIYINAHNRTDRIFTSYKLFISLVAVNMLMLVIDYLGWAFNGLPGIGYLFNYGFNLLLYMLAPVTPSLWVLYVEYQIFNDEKRIKKTKEILIILLLVNAAFSVASLITGWYFNVDAFNVYHRGKYFLVHVIYNFLLFAYSFFVALFNRNRIEKKNFYSLLLFFLPPAVGSTIQVMDYGVSYNWVGTTLSLLIIYFNIQNRGLNTDYLTGAYNRRQLDGYASAKIRDTVDGRSFAAIMLDLDNFKQINDNYGHDTGDEALKDTVDTLKKSIREDDFVARMGGDEFIVILDIQNYEMLEQAVARIQTEFDRFNEQSNKPYHISFSIGYDIYDVKSNMKPDDFLKHIDLLMYRDKQIKQQKTHKQDA